MTTGCLTIVGGLKSARVRYARFFENISKRSLFASRGEQAAVSDNLARRLAPSDPSDENGRNERTGNEAIRCVGSERT